MPGKSLLYRTLGPWAVGKEMYSILTGRGQIQTDS
jgi:hypothetical protein